MTWDSSLTGFNRVPAASCTFCVADPHGTCGAHTTTARPACARSWKEVILFGLPGATTMVSVLEAKVTAGPASRPDCSTLLMVLPSAAANTSAGAPWVNCVARSAEPAKENSTSVPGLSVLNCAPMSENAVFSDAAAKTVSFPPPVGVAAEHPPRTAVARTTVRRVRASRFRADPEPV